MEKISIVIPALNEEKRIGNTLKAYSEYFENIEGLDFEILVVLNACTDNTCDVVKEHMKKHPKIKLITLDYRGKGLAILEGFKKALKNNSELIGFVDADMATPPEAFYALIKNIGNYDGIIANRWDKRSIIKTKQTLLRRFVSRTYNIIIRSLLFLPYRDTQCGAKLFRRMVLEKNIRKIVSSDWNFDVALLFCLKKESNARIRSIPTIWEDKKESRVNLKQTPLKMLFSALRLRLVHSPFKSLLKLHGKLPEKLKVQYWLNK